MNRRDHDNREPNARLPRARGYAPAITRSTQNREIGPARAGMRPGTASESTSQRTPPRARGDTPVVGCATCLALGSAPRARGYAVWISLTDAGRELRPARAGIRPTWA